MPIWTTAGEPSVTKLLERVITDPSVDVGVALYDAAQDAQGAMIIQK